MESADGFAIRLLQQPDMDAFWQLRLRALREDPDAFGPSHGEVLAVYQARSIPPVRDLWTFAHAGECGETRVLVAVAPGGALVGFVGLQLADSEKSRHQAIVRGTYVAHEARKTGLGKRLMQRLIAEARAIAELEYLKLEVSATQEAARRLYESVGFQAYGTEPNALKVDGRYIDVIYMAMRL